MITIKKSWILLIILAINLTPLLASKSFSYPSSSGRPSSSSYSSGSSSHVAYRPYYNPYYQQSHNTPPLSSEAIYTFLLILLIILLVMFFVWLLYTFFFEEKKQKPIRGNKNHAYHDYEKVAEWFQDVRSQEFYEKKYLDQVLEHLASDATILDLGSGMGKPVTEYFIKKGLTVTAVDGSQKLIRRAQHLFPQTNFIIGDMRTLQLHQKFDAIILWHSLFHLPHKDQIAMFAFFKNHLNTNGILLFTSGPYKDERWNDNGGILMYHASFSATEYKKLLKQYGFELLLHVIEDQDCGGATVWMARFKKIENITL
ncbi:class I SAM-dependent methyltransferase [Candidatus Babeliales bacterium]|nr:class I SAM-dependent methyltransferase [Candidatus Babeliales bacterium]MBP9844048.1 class I SAM-dependent methyltransferase [Candidatus Babeliales bacterium]